MQDLSRLFTLVSITSTWKFFGENVFEPNAGVSRGLKRLSNSRSMRGNVGTSHISLPLWEENVRGLKGSRPLLTIGRARRKREADIPNLIDLTRKKMHGALHPSAKSNNWSLHTANRSSEKILALCNFQSKWTAVVISVGCDWRMMPSKPAPPPLIFCC